MQMPTAMPRRRVNHCEVSATSGAKVDAVPRNPISSPCARLNCHRLLALPAATKPAASPTLPSTTGSTTPKRSASRPISTPPRPKPIIVSVYGSEASARSTPNSAWICGSTTVTEYMPDPPSVISASEAARRHQARADSAGAAAGRGAAGSAAVVMQAGSGKPQG
jgi:hypothetical protein